MRELQLYHVAWPSSGLVRDCAENRAESVLYHPVLVESHFAQSEVQLVGSECLAAFSG
jgi:hypothetical protein